MAEVARGPQSDVTAMLRANGWPVLGVYVGGCVSRGVGSSFRALAHTHTRDGDPYLRWICVRSAKRVLTDSGKPTRILLHEVAHVIAPKSQHGNAAFVKALSAVGIHTDSYSRAGRSRAARKAKA